MGAPSALLLCATLCAGRITTGTQVIRAQDLPTRSSFSLAGGIGVARGTFSLGDSRRSATGFSGIGRFRYRILVIDLESHPYAVPNPVADERFSSVYALPGLWLRLGRRAYLLPAIGLQFRHWSGSERIETTDAGVALGAALGARLPLGHRTTVGPEFAFRWALIEVEGSVTTHVLSLRLVVARDL
jgi:hypothetical protein